MNTEPNAKQTQIRLSRGLVMDYMVEIEAILDEIIIRYFVKENPKIKKHFVHAFLAKQSVNASLKVDAVQFILINHFEKESEKVIKPMFAKLRNMIEYRNHCAHRRYPPEHRDNENEETFYLEYFTTEENTNKIKKIAIDINKMEGFVQDCFFVANALLIMLDKLINAKEIQ